MNTRARIPQRFLDGITNISSKKASNLNFLSLSLSLSLSLFRCLSSYTRSRDLNQFNASNAREPLIIDRHSFRRKRSTLPISRAPRDPCCSPNELSLDEQKARKPFRASSSIGFHYFNALHRGTWRAGPFAVLLSFLFPGNSRWSTMARDQGDLKDTSSVERNYKRPFSKR